MRRWCGCGRGRTWRAFARRAGELARRYPRTQGVQVISLAPQAKVEQAIQPQADALALFAALAGLAVPAVIGQLLSLQLIVGAADYPVLSALGAGRRQLFWLAVLRAGVVCTAGACVAVVIAVAASALMPIGPARLAEPDPGVQANLGALGLGLVAVAVLPVLVIAPVAWHAAGAGGRRGAGQPEPAARSRLATALAALGGVPAAAMGARMAFEPGRGRSAVPVRSALTGTAVAVATVVAALVFSASLARLVDTPRLYGQNWTLGLSLGFGSAPASGPRGVASFLAGVPGVAAYAGGNWGQISIDGQQVAAVGIRPLHRSVFLTLLDGAPPASRSQIVLGARTLRRLGKQVGGVVFVQPAPGARPARMRITGEAIFPSFGVGIGTPTGLGDGAAVFAPLIRPNTAGGCSRDCYDFYLIRFRPETPRTDISALGSRFVSALTAAVLPRRDMPGADRRPASRDQQLRPGPRHAAGPRRAAGAPRHRPDRPGAAHHHPAPPPRLRDRQDPRIPPVAGIGHRRLAGDRTHHRGAAGRPAPRRSGRALGLGPVRRIGWHRPQRHRPPQHRAPHDPARAAGRQRDRGRPRMGSRPDQTRHHPAKRVTPNAAEHQPCQ